MYKKNLSSVTWLRSLGIAVTLVIAGFNLQAADLSQYVTCDVEVVYLFDDPAAIDWPTLYYLNDEFGCRIDLVSVSSRSRLENRQSALEDRQIYLTRWYIPDSDSLFPNETLRQMFPRRRPDVVIVGDIAASSLAQHLKSRLLTSGPASYSLFDIQKVFVHVDPNKGLDGPPRRVVLNSRELSSRYRDRIDLELPRLLPGYRYSADNVDRLSHYQLVSGQRSRRVYDESFLSGIEPMRLEFILDSLVPAGPSHQTMLKQARKFVSAFTAARISRNKPRADLIVEGYRAIRDIASHHRILSEHPAFASYVSDLAARAEAAAEAAVGLHWDSRIVLRDSPHGPRLKFRASVSAEGPKEVQLRGLAFHPYWDTLPVSLDTVPRVIGPHQSFTREYLVEIDRSYLEGKIPDSLVFTMDVTYGQIPLVFSTKAPVWDEPDLSVRFEPGFFFVQPFSELDIDRVVSSTNWKVVLSKPLDFADTVSVNLTTPRGMFAGAYRKEIPLDRGSTIETIRVPFTISNLFELGVQQAVVELLVDGRPVAADSGRIRIAACHVDDKIQVGFLPDTLGMLEDVLRMTDAAFQPLTDRSLVTADLVVFDVILIGSGAARNYPSLPSIKGRLEEFVRHGGSLILFGQPEGWPQQALPLGFVPTVESVEAAEITNRIPEARVTSQPYQISEKNLLSQFYRDQVVYPAVVGPAERVYITPSGAALLSVTRIGDGQIIFCGFPLLEMISKLNIDAVHLFGNLLNY